MHLFGLQVDSLTELQLANTALKAFSTAGKSGLAAVGATGFGKPLNRTKLTATPELAAEPAAEPTDVDLKPAGTPVETTALKAFGKNGISLSGTGNWSKAAKAVTGNYFIRSLLAGLPGLEDVPTEVTALPVE